MLFKRALITVANSLPTKAPAGSGFTDSITPVYIATNADLTLQTTQMCGGAVVFTSFTAARNVTTPSAAAMLAEASDMDIGDSFIIHVTAIAAFAANWVAGAGVTLLGRTSVPASTHVMVVVTKTSATTVTWASI